MSQENLTKQLAHSWNANAAAWTHAVRSGAISSRRLATDAAIVQALLERQPDRVLDLGCGEGWLARALSQHGIEAIGIDASAPLIEQAQASGGGTFHQCSYSKLTALPNWMDSQFDAIACNFALLEENISDLLAVLRDRLTNSGALVIQTVHPWAARGNGAYYNGWRTETFSGFGDGFTEAMPWYFRTLSSWIHLLRQSGYAIDDVREPLHPATEEPLSLLLIATA